MKKILIGSLIGGLIIFIWQFLSFAAIDLHYPAHQYTDKQDAILQTLSEQQLPEGGYLLPSLPRTAAWEEYEAHGKNVEGKPWAMIQYHHSMETDMTMNMVRGLIVNMIAVGLLCWILLGMRTLSFGRVLFTSLFTGLIVFLNGIYIGHIWYQYFDTSMHLLDAIVSWGVVGLWLGWWLPRGHRDTALR